MKNLFCLMAACSMAACFAEEVESGTEEPSAPVISVSNVKVEQDSLTKLVTVSYDLGDAPVIITVDFLTNGVSIGEENFNNVFGAVNRVVTQTDTAHTIHWQPSKSWPGHSGAEISAQVTAWDPADPPDYMAVALGDTSIAPVTYYVSTNALPGTLAVDVWRTSRLLMRRIHAKDVKWRMGEVEEDFVGATAKTDNGVNVNVLKSNAKAHQVTLTEDYFIGVYPITQEQYRRFTGASTLGGAFTEYEDSPIRPRTGLNFKDIRGEGTGVDHIVKEGSALYKMRDFTGIDFDLPTEAQWEYAGHAGVPGPLYSGKPLTSANVNELAWVWHSDPQTHPVGRKIPNNWGLYDMIGNMLEWCLDRYVADLGSDDVIDPLTKEGADRVMRGSRYNYSWAPSHRITNRGSDIEGRSQAQAQAYGFRVMCPLTLKFPTIEEEVQ